MSKDKHTEGRRIVQMLGRDPDSKEGILIAQNIDYAIAQEAKRLFNVTNVRRFLSEAHKAMDFIEDNAEQKPEEGALL